MEKTQTQKTTKGFQLATQFFVFMELAARMHLTGTEKLMYLHLLQLVNKVWNHKAVKISDADFIHQLNLHGTKNNLISQTTLSRAKNTLADWGLIVYTAGTSKKKITKYQFTPLTMETLKNSDFLLEDSLEDTFDDSLETVYETVDPSISARTDAKKTVLEKIYGTVLGDRLADSSGTVDADNSRTDNNRARPKIQDPRQKIKNKEKERRALSEKKSGRIERR